jgi:anti-sigma regulatory factor (Ser/Thr protein kinase)
VLGAAVSEVEKYARVQIAPTPELMVQGRVVNDLAHLVAELLDNATAFSKPTTKVTVRTIETRKGEVAIRIHDRGVGIQENEVGDFNAKLAEPPEVDVSVAREMGLFVVGQLAKRHEIRVTLANNDDIEGGVTAQVILPVSLLHKGAAPALPLPPAPAPASETTSTGEALSGVPKWTPEHPVVVPSPATEENSGRHRIEQTSTDGLFTARIEAAEDDAEAGYSYEPPVDRPVDPATEIFPAIVDEPLISHDDLSRWFQTPAAPEPVAKEAPPAAPEHVEDDEDAEPATVNGLPKRQRSAETVKIEAPTAVPRAVADYAADSDWGAPDEGWKAAGALGNGAPSQTTENGLPKRVPKARLIPGSLPSPSSPAPQLATAAAVPARSADKLRQRFATYQKGVQMGRDSLFDSAVGGIPVIAERERQ